MSLAIIIVSFDQHERPKAFGIFGGFTGLAVGLSVLVVQWLNQSYGWRSAFTITLLVGIAAFFLVLKLARESVSSSQKRVDFIGIILCAAGLIGIVYGINKANGPSGFLHFNVLTPIFIGLAIMCVFFWLESQTHYAALPFGLFLNRVFSVSMVVNVLMGLGVSGVTFQLSNYLQILLKLPPAEAALMMLPFSLSLFAFAIIGGLLIGRFGNRKIMFFGNLIAAFGLVLIIRILSPSINQWNLIASEILFGLGVGIANTAQANVTLSVPPKELAGSASAANNAGQALGSSLGIALLNTLFVLFGINAYNEILSSSGLNQTQIQKATMMLKQILESNIGSIASRYSVPVSRLEGLVGAYQQAYHIGFTEVLWITVGVFLFCAALSWYFIFKDDEKI